MLPQPPPITRWELRAIVCLVLMVTTVLVSLAFTVGVTVDEPSHLLSAHLYWQGKDTLDPGDMPPLIKIVGGWVPRFAGIKLPPPEHAVWKTKHEWAIANEMAVMLTAQETERLFGWSRLPFLVFPLACLVLIWWWARQIFSPAAGLFAAALFAMTPMVLGHGALFKNDLAASFALLLFSYRNWRLWVDCSARNGIWLAFAALLGVLAKLSMLLLPPLAVLIMAGCCLRARRYAWFPLLVLGGAALVWGGIVLAWQLDLQPVPEAEVRQWSTYANTPRWFLEAVRLGSWVPLPARFWRGFWNLASSNSGTDSIYFLGKIHGQGQPHYFAIAYLLKTPVMTLAVIAVGVVLGFRRGVESLFWLLPAVLYAALASTSNLQIGLRLVLPAIVCLAMAAGALGDCVLARRRRTPVVALLLWGAGIPAVAAYPHFIPYCNFAAGLEPGAPAWFFTDSNLDWGQSLPPLAKYLREHPEIDKLRLFYFGTGWPGKWLPDDRHELLAPPWTAEWAKGTVFKPEPGYYAISVTLYTSHLFERQYRGYFRQFQQRKPIAAPGGSVVVFRIP